MSDVSDIESVVLVKRDIEKTELYKIADRIGYSYRYIKNIGHITETLLLTCNSIEKA